MNIHKRYTQNVTQGLLSDTYTCVTEVFVVCSVTAKILSQRGGAAAVRQWARAVERRLDRSLAYPPEAVRGLEVGVVELEFDLLSMRHGAPGQVRLIGASGGPNLDAAALAAVQSLTDLPDPPLQALGDCALVRAQFGRPAAI